MEITRRQFLVGSGADHRSDWHWSPRIDGQASEGLFADLKKVNKFLTATRTTNICCYCSVGCGLICSTDENGKIFNVEGDPDHPINEGTLCPKGANILQNTGVNEHRLTKVLYRAPNGSDWEEKDMDWLSTK